MTDSATEDILTVFHTEANTNRLRSVLREVTHDISIDHNTHNPRVSEARKKKTNQDGGRRVVRTVS
jgi:hypothetical protein